MRDTGFSLNMTYIIKKHDDLEIANEVPEKTTLNDASVGREFDEKFIEKIIRRILGKAKESAFSLDRPLMEMGLDSMDLLELNHHISMHYQRRLEPTFLFQYNTATRIINYLKDHYICNDEIITMGITEKKSEQLHNENILTSTKETNLEKIHVEETFACENDIAIIGISCRFPGKVTNKDELWELLISGEDVTGDLPENRWEWPSDIDPANAHKGINKGGFLEDIANFDAAFFRVSPKEAELMDPQQRILLELSWSVLEDAGYRVSKVAGSSTGVFIGASGSSYATLLESQAQKVDAHFGVGTSMASLANRISYFYDLSGPSVQIDTACSSSLVAIRCE